MPHGETWITLLLQKIAPGFWEWSQHMAPKLGSKETGGAWLTGAPIGLTHVFSALFVLLVIAALAYRTYQKIGHENLQAAIIPDDKLTVRTFAELFVGAVYGMMKDIMGPKAAKFFLPLIGTCAFFIFFSNIMGLVPGMAPATDNLNTTLACALIIFFSTHIFGLKENGWNYVKHFFGPKIGVVWIPLMLLMLAVELISHIARPMSLSIRLFANMFADHLVLGIFLGFGALSLLLPVPIMMLGTLVCIVQTLVFCILSTVYISMAIAHSDHGDGDHGDGAHGHAH